MAELRGVGDVPDDGDASARHFPADTGNDAGEPRSRHEPSPRAEYAEIVRQRALEVNAAQPDASHADTDQVKADQSTEGSIADALERFDPWQPNHGSGGLCGCLRSGCRASGRTCRS